MKDEIQFDKVSVLSLQPDDVLVFSISKKLSEANWEALKGILETQVPGHKAIILEDDAKLSVLRPDERS